MVLGWKNIRGARVTEVSERAAFKERKTTAMPYYHRNAQEFPNVTARRNDRFPVQRFNFSGRQ